MRMPILMSRNCRRPRAFGLQLQLLQATNEREIDAAFAAMAQNPPGALFVAADAYLTSRRDQIVAHVARLRIPAIYPRREYVGVGGLISYAAQALDAFRLTGNSVSSRAKSRAIYRSSSRPRSS